jgi:hypothetical protein
LIGRPTFFDAHVSATSSGYRKIFEPKRQHERGHQQSLDVRILIRDVDRVALVVLRIARVDGARFDRVRHEALVDDIERRHVRGLRERGVGRGLVAVAPVVADVVRHAVVHERPARVRRARRIDRRGQLVVIDLDEFGRVLRLLHRFRDDERDLIAHVQHLVVRDDGMRRLVHRRAVGAVDEPAARQAADVLARHILAGKYADHARRLHRGIDIDALDFRVRMRRAQEYAVALLRHDDIVGVLARARQEAIVFLAFDAGADQFLLLRGIHRGLLFKARFIVFGRESGWRQALDFIACAPWRTAFTML